MASNMARIQQRAQAVQRLTNAANAAADALDVERADIPTSHKDAQHLPTLQIDAVAALLERIAGAMGASAIPDEPTDDEPDVTPAKHATRRTARKDG